MTLVEEPVRTPVPAKRARAHWWVLPPLLLVVLVAVYPLLRVLGESARPGIWAQVLGSAQFRDALWRTVAIAVTSTLGCLLLGAFLAVVLAFVPFPGSRLVGRLIDTVLALPSFLITLAFTFLYGTAGVLNSALGLELDFLYTPAGVIAAEITFFTPFVVRPLLAAFALIPPAQLNIAASLGASPWRVLRAVVLPEAWPALMAGGALVLLLTLNEFGIVLFTGAKGVLTLPVLIYTRGIVTFDLPGAAVIATVQVVLSLALYLAYRKIFARMMSGRGGPDAAVEPAK
ncbi:2-aminoethylphosphonate ABC transporter permease subunit [Mycolicibacterium cosmeticum]|uniref:ABC transporter permease n=1 Tax=Mycolicibacterium cosmeticum TaxID=258533 RepID=W9ARX7_MYCCO|nr:2-aminoethylphosphonate ABC transporter permease subunit [Mycolicibacterium cosmeticum]TLH65148.1 2-aminoethylphosphonate ABC transporter permease subunit [Mycolicibacterium cosmeticum]CDO08519.1 ABC transporter permease [Mycolicibacterium cosmeticum]